MLSKLQNLKWPGKDKPDSSNKAKTSDSNADAQSKNVTSRGSEGSQASTAVDLSERLNHPKEKIRTAACLELKDSDQLLKISSTDSSDAVRLVAARQYAKLLPSGQTAKDTLSSNFANTDTKHLALLITAQHNDVEVRQHGLALFKTDEDFMNIAIETRFHDTRQTVARQIQSLAVVDQCYRKLKTKDKLVARELKNRLSEQHDKIELQNEQQEQILKITDEMQKLADGAWSPTLTHRYELFAKKWTDIDFEISPTQTARYETFRSKAHEKVSKNLSLQKQHDDCEEIIQKLAEVTSKLNQSSLEKLPETFPVLKKNLSDLYSRWQTLGASESSDIDKKHQQHYSSAKKLADKELSYGQKTLSSVALLEQEAASNHPGILKKQLKTLEELQTQFEQSNDKPLYSNDIPPLLKSLEEKIKQSAQQAKELKTSINKQFISLNSAISSNRWGPAKSIHERLARKISRLSGSDKKHYTEKLERLEKKLNELGDWKQFATEPKLEALCELMEKVPTLGLNPGDQADRIKDLQNQWKSMGANPAQEKHWPRFKQAADTAYEPCAKHFAEKRAEKDLKLKKRTEICEMLQTYIDKSDWQNPDWKLVEKTIRTAKNEWRNTRVFDRKAGAKLDDRFTEILATLNEKLEPAYAAGSAEKTELIEKVKALGEGEVNQHCINQVKKLQSMWKRTGTTRRADDQKLWKTFNEACSEIYNSHRGKQREQYAASVEHVTRAKQIISELKAVRGSAQPADEKALQQLQDEFEALPEFPERDQKYLFRDFNRAVEGVEQHRQKMTDQAQHQEIQRLHHNAAICEQLESLSNISPDTVDAEIERILSDWDDGEKTDKAQWKKAISKRKDSFIAHLKAGTLPDYESNTQARRLLCIENEILHDKDTPAEDKQLRMQYQLEKLQQGLSNASAGSRQEQFAALQLRWLTALPPLPELRDKLNTRFNSVSEK